MRNIHRFFLIIILFFPASLLAADAPAAGITPDQALQRLMDGNKRYTSGQSQYLRQDEGRRSEVAQGQRPFAAILSCADSRVPPEVIFDKGLGDLFVVRIAGNTVNNEGLGSLEYGTSVLGAPLILVLGHTSCGAVDAAMQGKPLPGHMPAFVKPIDEAIQEDHCKVKKEPLTCSIQANVDHVVEQLKTKDPILAPLLKEGKLKVVGAVYDLATGQVTLQP